MARSVCKRPTRSSCRPSQLLRYPVWLPQHDQLPDDIFQFPDVSRPIVGHQRLTEIKVNFNWGIRQFRMFRDEVLRKGKDFFSALPQRRNLDADNIEAIIQIFAKTTVVDRLLEIAVSSRDHPHIHFDGFPGTQSLKFPVLQHLQQFGLELEIHVADFIQQDRAAIRSSNLPGTFLNAPVKAPRS